MKQLLALGRVRGGARQSLVRWMALAIIIVPAVALAIAVGGVTVPAVGIACWLVGAGLLGAIKLVEPRDRRAVGLIVGSAIALRLAIIGRRLWWAGPLSSRKSRRPARARE